MLSGHIQGLLLAMLSRMIKPQYILEIGTYTGYSAICLAEGLTENGMLYSIDKNDELTDFALKYIKKAGKENQIRLKTGDAIKIIPELRQTFDLVFIDADKTEYCEYYSLVFPKIRKNGWILADNVLWSGKVTDDKTLDPETRGIREFNEMVQQDRRTENIIIPQRDGLMMIRKIKD